MNTREKTDLLDIVLNRLMERYTQRVRDVAKILDALIERKAISKYEDIENDHIAFRTMGVEHLGVASLEKIFLHCGYRKMDYFYFPGKKLDAWWYSPPQERFPRVFISQLRVGDLPTEAASVIRSYTDEVKRDPVDLLDLDNGSAVGDFLHSPLWKTPSLKDYEKLLAVSEYAAWVIYNRYYLNHYTISVHNLPSEYSTLAKFNGFLEGIGIRLNDAGGKIKTSEDGLLLQSSTVSELCEARFAENECKSIAGSYVEFAERKVLPKYRHLPPSQIQRSHRRDGFETGNADKIFESTYNHQINKKAL